MLSGRHCPALPQLSSYHRLRQAESDGLKVYDIADAVAAAQLVYLLVPDEVIADCYSKSIMPAIRAGTALCFGSGYPIAYHLMEPRPDIDVLMVAPRMLGHATSSAGVRTGVIGAVACKVRDSGAISRTPARGKGMRGSLSLVMVVWGVWGGTVISGSPR